MILFGRRGKSIKQRRLAFVKKTFELEREIARSALQDYEELQWDSFVAANTGNGGLNSI
jgi:hypothetical protein